jgi:class 3 adenylate cyclase
VPVESTATDQRFVFDDRLEIGREIDGTARRPGLLLIADPSVSRRHCVLTRTADGRLFVRDLSTNGVWVDGRRLVPNLEVEIRPGQVLGLGSGHRLRLEVEGCESVDETPAADAADPIDLSTIKNAAYSQVTVLVGDIRRYTRIVTAADTVMVERSVNALFQLLYREVTALDGTLKEYPGDAILAFWEHHDGSDPAVAACQAALALHHRVQEVASMPDVWNVPGFPLAMDWALATGPVVIQAIGDSLPVGLSMVGAPVILAFRLEKLAGADTGSILVCDATRAAAGDRFQFRDLGEMVAEGFESPTRVFALQTTSNDGRSSP